MLTINRSYNCQEKVQPTAASLVSSCYCSAFKDRLTNTLIIHRRKNLQFTAIEFIGVINPSI